MGAAAMTALWHYTANSGHVAQTGREDVDQAVIDRLLPIVLALEGDLLGLGIDILLPTGEHPGAGFLPGTAFFQIGPAGERMSRHPYVMAIACWRADREARAWAQFREIAEIGAEAWPNRPAALAEPPDIPWLAVNLLPHAAALSPEALMTIGDLERCLAWALIESEQQAGQQEATPMQTVALPQPPSPGAARMARHRRRRKEGLHCLLIEIRPERDRGADPKRSARSRRPGRPFGGAERAVRVPRQHAAVTRNTR
jgi:hypothetical protein